MFAAVLLLSREEDCVPWSASNRGWSQECSLLDAGGGNPATHSSQSSLYHLYPYWGWRITQWMQNLMNVTVLDDMKNKLSAHMHSYFPIMVTFVPTTSRALFCSRMLHLSTVCYKRINITSCLCFANVILVVFFENWNKREKSSSW